MFVSSPRHQMYVFVYIFIYFVYLSIVKKRDYNLKIISQLSLNRKPCCLSCFIRICVQGYHQLLFSTANHSHTGQLTSGTKLLESPTRVELQREALLGQLDCLEYGRDGFIGYLREHSLLPLHSQQPAYRQACIIDGLQAVTTLSQRSGYPPCSVIHTDATHASAHTCWHHLC